MSIQLFLYIVSAVFVGTLIENLLLGFVQWFLQDRAKRRLRDSAIARSNSKMKGR